MKFPDDSHGFPNGNLNVTPCLAIIASCHVSFPPVIVRGDVNDLHKYLLTYNSVDHAVLKPESRGPVALPFATKDLVVEAFDQPQAGRAGDSYDILPFLIPLESLGGNA